MLKSLVDADVVFPPSFCGTIVKWAAASATDAKTLVDILNPYGGSDESVPFQPFTPLLRAAKLSEVDSATLMMKSLIHERLVPLLAGGEKQFQSVLELAKSLKGMRDSLPATASAVLATSIGELGEVADFFIGLSEYDLSRCQDAAANIRFAKSGVKMLIKSAIAQNKWWKELDAQARADAVAEASLGPEVRQALERLQKDEADADDYIITALPRWMDNLRKNVIDKVVGALQQHMSAELDTLVKALQSVACEENEMNLQKFAEKAHKAAEVAQELSELAKRADKEWESARAAKLKEQVETCLARYTVKDRSSCP